MPAWLQRYSKRHPSRATLVQQTPECVSQNNLQTMASLSAARLCASSQPSAHRSTCRARARLCNPRDQMYMCIIINLSRLVNFHTLEWMALHAPRWFTCEWSLYYVHWISRWEPNLNYANWQVKTITILSENFYESLKHVLFPGWNYVFCTQNWHLCYS